jgi:hypothetical protein
MASMKNQDEWTVAAYGFGMERGAYLVFDLIDEGVRGDALRELAMRRIAQARERYRAGLEAAERFGGLSGPAVNKGNCSLF